MKIYMKEGIKLIKTLKLVERANFKISKKYFINETSMFECKQTILNNGHASFISFKKKQIVF